MNYLAHLHLGGLRPADLLGSLYGDFVKGPLQGRWPADIEAAIRLHRRIDAFTDGHPVVCRARARFPEARRRYAGILLDVFFDHCLALHWADYAAEPLPAFAARVYALLAGEAQLPGRLAELAPRMAQQDWLGSYRDFAVLERVLAGMQRRLSRPEGLAGALDELERLYEPLSSDFRAFYPQLQDFARLQQDES
ncbi:ACP phosphodiesterase [Azotobacter beijerinckii]|uniref:Acyl carrier protein phosphodiesterase n=1 Tax=Azotobacter beijerinckii TaxID=170623 RepID=A0A1I3ZQX0_9GAMM|nr:ACP phosphodiesterase [Azotobacter beijerinckii]SFB25617.1 Acyl carrier protein phosphodiesterase [Azotobacter beijerinckii]SFK46280.1 Acyl carrier protein phosphodiesterase [Azotobacter beijerinckii]